MKRQKHSFLILFPIFWGLFMPFSALAEVPLATPDSAIQQPENVLSTSENTDSANRVIVSIQNLEELTSIPAQTLPLHDNLEGLYELALSHCFAYGTLSDEKDDSSAIRLRVQWDFNCLDADTPGNYTVTGELFIPEGYDLDPALPREFTISVAISQEPASPGIITRIEEWKDYIEAIAIPAHTSLRDFENTFSLMAPSQLNGYDEAGKLYLCKINWELNAVNLEEDGVYSVIGRLTPPDNASFSSELVLPVPTIPVSVQLPGRPDLNCFLAGRGFMVFPWVTPPGSLEAIQVWLSENGGDWTCISEDCHWTNGELYLPTKLLKDKSSYELQVDYDGGKTGIFSFTYDKGIFVNGYRQGSRDGSISSRSSYPEQIQAPPVPEESESSDDSASTLQPPTPSMNIDGSQQTSQASADASSLPVPSLIPAPRLKEAMNQTASLSPEAISQPTSVPEAVPPLETVPTAAPPLAAAPKETAFGETPSEKHGFWERFTKNADAVSGFRLSLMFENGKGIARFSKHGILLSIPASALTFKAEDCITVFLQKTADEKIIYSVSVNDIPVSSLSGATLMVPLNGREANSLCLIDENGGQLTPLSLDSTQKAAIFPANTPGCYQIFAEPSAQTSAKSSKSLWNLAASLALGGGGALILLKRRGYL